MIDTLPQPATNAASLPTELPVHLPEGILGFERYTDWVLISVPGEEPFQWLQVVDNPRLAFVVVEPDAVTGNYFPDIAPEDVERIGLESPEDALLLNIVTVRPHGKSTVNLKGPIVLNRHTMTGKQVIPVNALGLDLQHPLPVGS
jgi:flagellar assembly factor FliW